ncbi:MAG TPA: response regulator [Flavobacteriales bacterium]|jgi:DNA-binding NtrC family response regulator|nr:sigma-54 dependent transcriptional regulator [Salibacteraceae bacterium]HAS35006.1 response regulator [Flavobacteriales bacterium]
MPKILIVDDERSIRNSLKEVLEYEKFEIHEAEDGMEGLQKIKATEFDLILCDIKMPKMDGIDLLELALEAKPNSTFIMISGHGTIDTAVAALKKGAFDYIPKPIDLNRLLVSVRNAMDRQELIVETQVLRKKINRKFSSNIIGESENMRAVFDMIDKVAPTDARVLITGPNGTGKELVARQIHEKSNRIKSPFIEVNCAAIPAELIESELFGHEKGAFTSAIKQRKGKFEQAHGGTLFLDEIGDMSLSAQAKVLRALQEHKISRVGGDKDIKVDVRILAATNKDLKKEITEKNFREDLYHRLGVILIELPPLRERLDDIPLLVNFFLDDICKEQGIKRKEISDKGIAELQKASWTGNIRELRNVVERLVILSDDIIDQNHVKSFGNA